MASNGGASKEKGANKNKSDNKDLDLANSTRGVWLVKVPKYISDRWEKAAPDTEVGKLRIKKIPGAKHEVRRQEGHCGAWTVIVMSGRSL